MAIDFADVVQEARKDSTEKYGANVSDALAGKFTDSLNTMSNGGENKLTYLGVRQALHDAQGALMAEGAADGNILSPADFRFMLYNTFDGQNGLEGDLVSIGREKFSETMGSLPAIQTFKEAVPDLNNDDLALLGTDLIYMSHYADGVSQQESSALMHDFNKMRMERGEEAITPEAFGLGMEGLAAAAETVSGKP
jgi:hypothetical protein